MFKRILLSLILIVSMVIILPSYAATYQVPKLVANSTLPSWNVLFTQIKRDSTATILLWSGNGGSVNIGHYIINTLQYIQKYKPLFIHVNGKAISDHALIICNLSNVSLEPGSSLVFHAGFNRGRNKAKIYVDPSDAMYELAPCVQKGYLTYREAQNIAYYHVRIVVHANGTHQTLHDWSAR